MQSALPEAQLNFTIIALQGTARRLAKEKKTATFAELKQQLLSKFHLANEDYHLDMTLRARRQRGEDLDTYLQELNLSEAR